MTNGELAQGLHVSAATISMWESGERSSREIGAISKALGLPADQAMALEDMWSAAGSVTVITPRLRWAHNFPEPPTPAWAWIRPAEVGEDGTASVHVTNWWGEALQGSRTFTCGASGVFLFYATTVTNPPLEVSLATAGWVDFGRGRVPADLAVGLGAAVLDARQMIAFSMPVDQDLAPEHRREARGTLGRARDIALALDLGWRIFIPHLGMIKPQHATHSLDGSSLQPAVSPGETVTDSEGRVERQLLVSAAQLRALREGRGLSREQVMRRVNELDRVNPVTTHAIEMMEATGKIPGVAGLLAALDHVYGCDGRLGLDRIFDSVAAQPEAGSGYATRFPAYYVGPVWVQATGRDANDTGIVDLTWGSWRRRQKVRSAMIITTRKARADSVPLHIAVPKGWRVTAGTGAAPTAADINRGWHPVSIRAGIAMLREGVDAIIASQKTPVEPRQPERR